MTFHQTHERTAARQRPPAATPFHTPSRGETGRLADRDTLIAASGTLPAPVIPQAAVQKDQQGHFVLVVDRAGRAGIRRVVLGEQTGTEWVVSEGLAEGERVVVQGLQKIRPDMVVNPVEARD